MSLIERARKAIEEALARGEASYQQICGDAEATFIDSELMRTAGTGDPSNMMGVTYIHPDSLKAFDRDERNRPKT